MQENIAEEIFGLLAKADFSTQVPLAGVKVEGDIAGRGARVKVTQRFVNVEDKPIEAVYKLPLPEGSAVCGFKAIIGDRIIEGEIEEKETAFDLYDDAMSEGHGAYLLDEERPNIFTLSVGNLPPGSTASLEIEYVMLLETTGSDVRFFLPTTISPRYIPDGTPDNNGIPVDEQVNPIYSKDVPYGLSILLHIHGKDRVASIESPSHRIRTNIDEDIIKVESSSETLKMDRDFVLNIQHKIGFENRGYIYRGTKGSFIQIDFNPKAEDFYGNGKENDLLTRKEIIFLLDCSGSMQGNSIGEALKALEIFLKGLEEGTRFNIIRFGSSFEKLLNKSVPYTSDTLTNILERLKRINADLGGTEVLEPLKAIYSKEIPSGYTREIILITDGQVGNERECTEIIQRGVDKTRLFTVGIGYGPNEYFIRQMARAGGGTSVLIAPNERIEPKILGLFQKIMADRVDNFTINWAVDAIQSPYKPVPVAGEFMSIFARISGEAGELPDEVIVSGKAGGIDNKIRVTISEIRGNNIPIPLLWAREMIRDLEDGADVGSKKGSKQVLRKESVEKEKLIELSKEFGIISRDTSFIAVEKRAEEDKTIGEVVLRKVPIMLTKGWHGMDIKKFFAPCFMRRAIPDITSVDEYSPYIGLPDDIYSPIIRNREVRKYSRQEVLLNILSLQQAQGGFIINKEAAKLIGCSFQKLKAKAGKIETNENTDRYILLSTAIILAILEKRFTGMKDTWGGVIEKSQKWFESEIKRTTPCINNISLEIWAEKFVENLKTVFSY